MRPFCGFDAEDELNLRLIHCTAALLLMWGVLSHAAGAVQWNWQIDTASSAFDAAGVLDVAGGTITSVTGTVGGVAIDGLVSSGAFGITDNQWSGSPPYLTDGAGFAFAANATVYIITYSGGIYTIAIDLTQGHDGRFTASMVEAPEPSALAVFGLAMSAVGAIRAKGRRWRLDIVRRVRQSPGAGACRT